MWFLFLLLTLAAGVGAITFLILTIKKRRRAWLGLVASIVIGAFTSIAFLVSIVMAIPEPDEMAVASDEVEKVVEKEKKEKKEDNPKEGAKDEKEKEEKKKAEPKKEKKKEKSKPKKEEKKIDVTSEKDIEKLVNELLGDTSNTDEKRVEKVVYNEVDTAPYIGLNLHADENITVKLARSGMLKDTLEIMKALNKEGYSGKFYVDWRLPLTDKYGDTEPGKVMSIDISAEDFEKINFDKVDYLNLPDIAESYFEHPGFRN